MEQDRPLTKAERKALRKQEKQTQQQVEGRRKILAKIGWWLGALAVVALIIYWGYSRYVPIPAGEAQKPVDRVLQSDWYIGNKDAKVMILEYSDFQCPACGAYYPVINQIKQDYGDKIIIVYRHFPLTQIHQQAQLAAQAAEAAGKQGKFWEMHDKLFETQNDWAEHRNAKTIFIGYAKDLGLNVDQFKKDLNSKEIRGLVKADYMSGLENRLNGTPSFFLNGERIQTPQGLDAFKQLIDQKLQIATAAGSLSK